jgi:uncharacterized protein (TIGR04255 family)
VPQTLPEFERPPLIEVVCGLQFQPLAALRTVHVGDFWQAMRDRYPSFEDHPPLANVFDDNDRGSRVEQEDFVFDMPPLRRAFFVDETKNFLLQLGASRFLANGRKLRTSDDYPRFDAAYARLADGWSKFREYAVQNDLGSIRLNQYELTYINHIPGETSEGLASELFTVFRWPELQDELFESSPHGMQLRFQVRFKKARGSLNVSLQRAMRVPDGRHIFILELTARGPATEDGADRDEWFAFAHEAVVQTFSSLTTEKAHKSWGRIR